jgi:putative flippase GtrA
MSTRRRVLRFIITGALTAVLYLTLSYLLKEMLELEYLVAATISYCIALVFNFLVQKFWSFHHSAVTHVHFEVTYYLCWSLVSLFLNLLLIYMMVSRMYLWYLLAQAVASVIVASASYFAYKRIFRTNVFLPE